MQDNLENAYDLIQVAEKTGMKVRTVREWVKKGKIKAVKLRGGRKWVVTESEIRRLRCEDED